MIIGYENKYLEELSKIEKECFSHFWTEKDLAESLREKSVNAYLFVQNNEAVGYILFRTVLDESEILRIGTKKEYRRKGVAESLIKYYFEKSKRIGVEKIFLEVRQSNFGAIELYKKLGFKQICIREKYYENTEDAVIMAVCLE